MVGEQITYTAARIAAILKAKIVNKGNPDDEIVHLLFDSRQLIHAGQSLFFALKTSKGNGHKYIYSLYQKGIRNFVVSEVHALNISRLPEANILLVKDSLKALQQLAAYHRKRFSYPVIGITGSNGKTIVKEWLQHVLQDHYEIVRSPKSYNSQIGVPLSVWQMSGEHNLAIFEAGISQVGEMDALREIIRPTIGIFTNIGEAHGENFINRRQKTGEKLGLFTHVQSLIYDNDYAEISNAIGRAGLQKKVNVFDWSRKNDAVVRLLKVNKKNDGSILTVLFKGQETKVQIPFIDQASVENSMHVISLVLLLGIPLRDVLPRLKTLPTVAMRLEMKAGINHCTIINDSYNSDINSIHIALDFLNQQFPHTRKTLILSDILQSRKAEGELYADIDKLLRDKGIDRFIGIGKALSRQQKTFRNIAESYFFKTTEDFLNHFDTDHFRDEGILIKGSRVFGFERISKFLQKKAHQTILEVKLSALVANLNYYRSKLLPETKIMVMVKAFSYGSGSVEIANVLQYHHADYLCVAYTDEGVELRKAGIKLPIMVLNPEAEGFDHILQYDLEPEIYSFEILKEFEQAVSNYPGKEKVKIHLKLDTGMHRLGFLPEEVDELCEYVAQNQYLAVASVFSHLASSDRPEDDEFTRSQYILFNQMVSTIQASLSYPFLRHILNTAGISRFPEAQMDMVRLGIGLYGVETVSEDRGKLQNVSSMKTVISQIKTIEKGDTVGYNRSFIAGERMRIAIVPVGYADGLRRSLSNGKGVLYVAGKEAPVVGKVCMDMTMIDVGDIDCKVGDQVVVFDENHPVTELAQRAGTIPYEILTGISKRVKRIYFHE